ncbi:MAG: hypothetical protein QM811_29655 [Pirellulales bacterium]
MLAIGCQITGLCAAPLYDGTLGTTLDAQGWTYMHDNGSGIPNTSTAAKSWASGATVLNTTIQRADRAGFLRVDQTLDRTTGFALTFDLRLLAEAHTGMDRAGFSLIALASDKRGIELGFWNDRVFAQNDSPLFTQGESTTFPIGFDPTLSHLYTLTMSGNTYSLSAAGLPTLTGALRDYTSFTTLPYSVVYNTPNLLFMGDDSGSAEASFAIASVGVTPIPEPWLGLGLIGCLVPLAYVHVRRDRTHARHSTGS